MTGGAQDSGVLLPCPFCGAKAHLSYNPKTGYFGPDADHAGTCPINLDFRDYADDHQAVREWNTRATPAPAGWQHVAYFDEGAFHWMSGIAPRDCELYARIPTAPAEGGV